MRFDLARLFKPKSIAVVGGGVWCRSVLEQCKKNELPRRALRSASEG